jgi:rubrerythrin
MTEAEKKRQAVTAQEVDHSREALAAARVPGPRNPRPADENQDADFACMRCGHRWTGYFSQNAERICPVCRSNSVRWLHTKE